jgi:hypothetical protein
MKRDELLELKKKWSSDMKEIHHLIDLMLRPPCHVAIDAIMHCDPAERDLVRRLCDSLDESSGPK